MGNGISIEKVLKVDDTLFSVLTKSFDSLAMWDRGNLERFVGSESAILLLARKGDDGCGLLRAHILPRYDSKEPEILLHEIDVSTNYQRQGVGFALIEKLKEIAREQKASEIWVITNRSNEAAMRLYEKAGMKETHNDDVVLQFETGF